MDIGKKESLTLTVKKKKKANKTVKVTISD